MLDEFTVDDVMTLADTQDVLAGKALIPSTILLPGGPIYYKPEEYAQHLKNILKMLKTYENYHVYMTGNSHMNNVNLICKCNSNVLIVKRNEPFSVFEMTEQRCAFSFCEYLRQIVSYEKAKSTRESTIQKTEDALIALNLG